MQVLNTTQIGPLSLGRGLGGRRSDEGRIQHRSKADPTIFTTQNDERKLEYRF